MTYLSHLSIFLYRFHNALNPTCKTCLEKKNIVVIGPVGLIGFGPNQLHLLFYVLKLFGVPQLIFWVLKSCVVHFHGMLLFTSAKKGITDCLSVCLLADLFECYWLELHKNI